MTDFKRNKILFEGGLRRSDEGPDSFKDALRHALLIGRTSQEFFLGWIRNKRDFSQNGRHGGHTEDKERSCFYPMILDFIVGV